MTEIGPENINGPLIPQTSNLGQEETKIFRADRIQITGQTTTNSITIANGVVSGIDIPINLQDAANKEYVDNTVYFSKGITKKIITTASNVTYTTEQILCRKILRKSKWEFTI